LQPEDLAGVLPAREQVGLVHEDPRGRRQIGGSQMADIHTPSWRPWCCSGRAFSTPQAIRMIEGMIAMPLPPGPAGGAQQVLAQAIGIANYSL